MKLNLNGSGYVQEGCRKVKQKRVTDALTQEEAGRDEFSLLTTTILSKTRPCFLMGVGITCQACVTERSTTERFAMCPKDHSTDDKDVNSTIDAQAMYHLMPNNMQHSDYKLLNVQVPMTDSQHVTTQSPNTAMYMHSGNMANLTVCAGQIRTSFSLKGPKPPAQNNGALRFRVHRQTR